jgi:hypothetical protein
MEKICGEALHRFQERTVWGKVVIAVSKYLKHSLSSRLLHMLLIIHTIPFTYSF